MVVTFVSNPLGGMTTYERYSMWFKHRREDTAYLSWRISAFEVCKAAGLVQTDLFCTLFTRI